MEIDIFLAIFGAVLLIVGFIGTIVPVIPGAPLAWIGLLIAFFSQYVKISLVVLVIAAIFAILVSILDNIFPIIFTKQSGGSKAGMWGSTIGLVIGLFIGPPGILVGPFLGAFIGELIHDDEDKKRALAAAFGAFKGFLLGTGLKMIVCASFIWVYILGLYNGFQ